MSDKKLTVVQVLPALESGGVERGTLEVGQYLAAQYHRSIVISAGGRMTAKLRREGSEHLPWKIGKKSLWTLRLIPRLRQFLRDNNVDILHVRSRFPAWICYLAWKGMDPVTRPHFITTVHGPYSVSPYSAVMAKGERIFVISKMIKDYVIKNYKVDADKLSLNYRGVDSNEYYFGYQASEQWRTEWYKQFPETKDKLLITLSARITRWKGQEDFIELIAQLKTQIPTIHGLIVGETKKGKSRFLEELKIKAENLGVADKITFTGYRSDIREIMSLSRIVMSLSREPEAFGRVTLESLSLGVPVIAYAHGGVEEQLAEMLPEGLVPVGNVAEAASLTESWLKQAPVIAIFMMFLIVDFCPAAHLDKLTTCFLAYFVD